MPTVYTLICLSEVIGIIFDSRIYPSPYS